MIHGVTEATKFAHGHLRNVSVKIPDISIEGIASGAGEILPRNEPFFIEWLCPLPASLSCATYSSGPSDHVIGGGLIPTQSLHFPLSAHSAKLTPAYCSSPTLAPFPSEAIQGLYR